MPCITGRSSHTLCDPGCADANKCCRQTNAFSCNRYCFCEENKKNPNNQLVSVADVRLMLCDAITSTDVLDGIDTDVTYDQLAGNICTEVLPSFECSVNLNIQQGNGPHIPLATIFKRQCSDVTDDDTNLTEGEWKLLLDTFECTTFTVAAAGP